MTLYLLVGVAFAAWLVGNGLDLFGADEGWVLLKTLIVAALFWPYWLARWLSL